MAVQVVLRLIDHANEIIEPPPTRIWYCYGEFQPAFNSYPWVHFHEGLPELSDRVFDGVESTLIILDDLISETNQLVANIGKVKFSHTRYRALGPELIPVYRQSARR